MVDTQQYNPPLFGLNIDPSAKNLELAYNLAQLADSTKLDFISIQDHPYNANFFDTWTLLTFLGARTQNVFFWPVMGDEEVQAKIFVEEIVPEVMAGIAGDKS